MGEGFGRNMQGAYESVFGILCRVYTGIGYIGKNKTFMHGIAKSLMPKEVALFLEIGHGGIGGGLCCPVRQMACAGCQFWEVQQPTQQGPN